VVPSTGKISSATASSAITRLRPASIPVTDLNARCPPLSQTRAAPAAGPASGAHHRPMEELGRGRDAGKERAEQQPERPSEDEARNQPTDGDTSWVERAGHPLDELEVPAHDDIPLNRESSPASQFTNASASWYHSTVAMVRRDSLRTARETRSLRSRAPKGRTARSGDVSHPTRVRSYCRCRSTLEIPASCFRRGSRWPSPSAFTSSSSRSARSCRCRVLRHVRRG
jgi:hypothetical protein